MAEHIMEIAIVDDTMRKLGVTGFQLQHLLLFPEANDSTFRCDCGVKIPVPRGSIAKYVEFLKKTYKPETMATIRVVHKYGSDPEKEAGDMKKLAEVFDQTVYDKEGKLKGYA